MTGFGGPVPIRPLTEPVPLSVARLADRAGLLAHVVRRIGEGIGLSFYLQPDGRPVPLDAVYLFLFTLSRIEGAVPGSIHLDFSIPHCLRSHFRLPVSMNVSLERSIRFEHLPACAGCPHRRPDVCRGLPAGFRFSVRRGTAGLVLRALVRSAPPDGIFPELLGLELGLRRAVRTIGPPPFLDRPEAAGLVAVPGPPVELPGHGRMAAGGPGAPRVWYVACDRGVAEELVRLECLILDPPPGRMSMIAEERRMGELLGYPACCIGAYLSVYDRHDTARLEHRNFLHYRMAAATGQAGWPLNIFFPEPALRPIAHFPCRFDCPASLALARKVLERAGRLNPIWPGVARHFLESQVVVAGNGRCLFFKGLEPDGQGWHFDHLLHPVGGGTAPLLPVRHFTVDESAGLALLPDGGRGGRVVLGAPAEAGLPWMTIDFSGVLV